MLLREVVDTSRRVTAERGRTAKVAVLATLLTELAPGEAGSTTALLAGEIPGGRVGVGAASLSGISAPAAERATLTVSTLVDTLAELRDITGPGSNDRRAARLDELFGVATEDEQRFLFRLLSGELRQGALEGVMLEAIAAAAGVPRPAVRRAFMLAGGLSETADAALRGGERELAGFQLHVGRPIRPMLASPADTLEAALTELAPAVVEYKLDGARIQVHRAGVDVHVYTRTLREITSSVPELVELTRTLPCDTVVLDGEALALSESARPRPFQETMGRFGARESRDLRLRPYFFDCLHLDGADLLDAPLRERVTALERVAAPHRVPARCSPTAEQAVELFDAALADGHEGVVVKALDSVYAAGRRGKSWRKLKPAHTVDLVVLAAEWGHGRRRGLLSNLHLGARDPDGGEPIMVGKTFKGLTDELLRWQTEHLPEHERARDDWAVHLNPVRVVEIELDGVQTSTRYPGGVALRFARVVRYRPDKEAAEADTITTLRDMLTTTQPK